MRFLLLLVALALVAVTARPPKHPEVYAVYTDFGPLNEQTIVVAGQVNLTDGTVQKQSTIFRYLGSSGSFDGISAYDQRTGVIYFVNDFANSYIFGVQTVPPYALQAPIFLEDNGVYALAFDWKQRSLIAVDFVQQTNQNRLISYPVDNAALGPKVALLPSGFQPGVGAVDADRNVYYNIHTNQTGSVLTVYDLTKGTLSNPIPVKCSVDKLFVDSRHPDFDSRLYGVHANFTNGQLHYDLANIDLVTGQCALIPLATSTNGICTTFSFDPMNGVLFYTDVSNSGQMLRTTSVRDGHSTALPIKSNFPFEDMAVRFIE